MQVQRCRGARAGAGAAVVVLRWFRGSAELLSFSRRYRGQRCRCRCRVGRCRVGTEYLQRSGCRVGAEEVQQR